MAEDDVVVAEGDVPFVELPSGLFIVARYRTVRRHHYIWGEFERIFWKHEFDGRRFKAFGKNDRKNNWVPMDERWASGSMEPMRARGEGVRFAVSYHHYWMHHYGSLSGPVTLEFDLTTMQIAVDMDLQFESG